MLLQFTKNRASVRLLPDPILCLEPIGRNPGLREIGLNLGNLPEQIGDEMRRLFVDAVQHSPQLAGSPVVTDLFPLSENLGVGQALLGVARELTRSAGLDVFEETDEAPAPDLPDDESTR
jgi:hypothetical protein